MLSIPEALEHVMAHARALAAEDTPLTEALGRTLAADVLTREDSPPFSNSAMDGYALRAADLDAASPESPVRLPVVGESSAGAVAPPICAPGTTVRIFTGAPIPAGADTVVMQENVQRSGGEARFDASVALGKNVRVRGEDARVGDVLLRAGVTLRAGDVGLLASQGVATLPLVRSPRVAIVSSGDELRTLDEPERPGSIINSNAYMLAAQVRAAGCVPVVKPIVRDSLPALIETLQQTLRECDAVVTSGGVSVGDHDLMRAAFEEVGVDMGFWKVAIKPGKPFAFGRHADGKPVIGLPGNPVSALVTFEVLVRPLLRAMAGDRAPYRGLFQATLGAELRHGLGRTEFVRAQVAYDAAGGAVCVPVPRRGSGALPALASVDALILFAADREFIESDETVYYLPLHDAPGRSTSPY